MRILFALDKFLKSEGGADKLAKGVASTIHASGIQLKIVCSGSEDNDTELDGIPVALRKLQRPFLLRDSDYIRLAWNHDWLPIIAKEIEAFKPDLVLTQNLLAPATIAAAHKAGIPSAIFFHGYRCVSPTFFYGQDALTCPAPSFWNLPFRHKLKWPLIKTGLQLDRFAYGAATGIIANSGYIQQVVERFFKRESELLFPVVDLSFAPLPAPCPNPNGDILFIKPQQIKGLDTMLATAKLMRDKKFLVVGQASKHIKKKLAAIGNIEYLPWASDMDAVYKRASVVFGPAMIPEPFGRVFIEAGLRGLPSVASQAGGIPEAVGEGGILVDPASPAEAWAAALRQALEPAKYSAMSEAGLHYAVKLVTEYSPQRLLTMLWGIAQKAKRG